MEALGSLMCNIPSFLHSFECEAETCLLPGCTAGMEAMSGGKSGGRKMLGFGDFGFFDRFGSSAAAAAAASSSDNGFFDGSSAAAAAAAAMGGMSLEYDFS